MNHRERIIQAAKLLKMLRASGSSEAGFGYLPLLAIAQLAHAKLLPAYLAGTQAGKLLENLLATCGSTRFDCTKFSAATTRIAAQYCPTSKNSGSDAALLRDILQPSSASLLEDPCMLGWFHQLLVKEENKDLRTSGEVAPESIARATQWFTPGWVADFLVDETLKGAGHCDMLARCQPFRFLDPACGAGHILTVAVERMTLADAAVARETSKFVGDSLAKVLRDELFGLDIDPLMIDLSAFAIYLKARTMCPELLDLPVPHLYFCRTASGADAIGSLRLGADLENAELYVPDSNTATAGLNVPKTTSQNAELDPIPFPLVSARIAQFSTQSSSWERRLPAGTGGEPLVSDAARMAALPGSSLELHLLPTQFHGIATNPPYLSHRMMPDAISKYLKRHYSSAHYDLYAAFISLGSRILHDGGAMAMICQQSFLSIQRYEKLRQELQSCFHIDAIAQLGPGAFAAKPGEKANNAIVVFHKLRLNSDKEEKTTRCWRLLTDAQKSEAETSGLAHIEPHQITHQTSRSNAATVPIGFWAPAEIVSLFHQCVPMESGETGIVCSNGLFTCDNGRFVKRFDQVAEHERSQFVPYDKGGGHKWFRTTPYLLRWVENGDEIRRFRKNRGQSASLPGEQFYFKSGVTYSYIGTRGFKARLLSPSSIFDIASSSIFSERLDQKYILGFLNSSLVCFLLGLLNPTINFQIGDLRRLPFITPDPHTAQEVEELTTRAIALAREVETFDSSSPCGNPIVLATGSYTQYLKRVQSISSTEQALQQEIDALIFALYHVSEESRLTVLSDPWVTRSRQPLCKPMTEKQFRDLTAGLEPTSAPFVPV